MTIGSGNRLGVIVTATVVSAAAFIAPWAARAESFPSEVLNSVVSLLPQWPGYPKGVVGPGGRPQEPEGTAVAVFPGGYLATNVHVIGRAKTVKIRLNDGRVFGAEIVGLDPATDIALIKAPPDLPVLETAAPPGLGDKVCAVGNQFGLGLSVTCGVVSAVGRSGTGFNPIEDFIQTDAVVNPGGSGGAMVDRHGRLIGLVSAIFTKGSDANIGVNFAAAMKLVMRVVQDLKNHGRVIRGQPGFGVRDLNETERQQAGGAAVESLIRGGPALKAGIEVGDIITAIGGRAIKRTSDVAPAIHMFRPGEPIEIEFRRGATPKITVLTMTAGS